MGHLFRTDDEEIVNRAALVCGLYSSPISVAHSKTIYHTIFNIHLGDLTMDLSLLSIGLGGGDFSCRIRVAKLEDELLVRSLPILKITPPNAVDDMITWFTELRWCVDSPAALFRLHTQNYHNAFSTHLGTGRMDATFFSNRLRIDEIPGRLCAAKSEDDTLARKLTSLVAT